MDTNSFCGYSLEDITKSPFEMCNELESKFAKDIEIPSEELIKLVGEFKRSEIYNRKLILKRIYKMLILYTYSEKYRNIIFKFWIQDILGIDIILFFGSIDEFKDCIDEQQIYSEAARDVEFELRYVQKEKAEIPKEIPDYMRLDYLASGFVGDWVFEDFPMKGVENGNY